MTEETNTIEQPALSAEKDGLRLLDDGEAVLRFGERQWRIRKPTFGQYRAAVTASDRAMQQAEEAAAEIDRLNDGTGSFTDPTLHAYVQWLPARFGWWRAVLKAIGDGPAFPKDDDLPMWLASADLVNEMIGHWLSVPPGAPGG